MTNRKDDAVFEYVPHPTKYEDCPDATDFSLSEIRRQAEPCGLMSEAKDLYGRIVDSEMPFLGTPHCQSPENTFRLWDRRQEHPMSKEDQVNDDTLVLSGLQGPTNDEMWEMKWETKIEVSKNGLEREIDHMINKIESDVRKLKRMVACLHRQATC